MKKTSTLVLLIAAVCSTLAIAAESDPAAKQLQVYPKNLARQHLGANLFVFNPKNQAYVPTEAAAAWLDDDVTTGWPALPGKQHYLVALPEPVLISNFSLSSQSSNGTVTLYAGDEPAIPGAKSWSPLTGAVAIDSVNDKKLASPFSRLAKYVLIETNIADPHPIYSLNLYGDQPASSYSLRKRPQTINSRAIFGQYINQKTAFNLNGIYAQGRVTYANSPDGFLAWQKGIDDNPESSLTIAGTTQESGAVIQYGTAQSVSRISLLTDSTAKGTLDFFLVNDAPPAVAEVPAADSGIVKASNTVPSEAPDATVSKAVSLEGKTPTISIVLDGSNARASVDFPASEANALLVRWTPANGTDPISIRELGSFGSLSLNDYEVGMNPEAVAQGGTGSNGKDAKDAKEIAEGPRDPKDPKALDPLAAGPTGSPYLPGALGFPPNFDPFTVPKIKTPRPPNTPIIPFIPPTPPTPPNTPVSPL
jgi:hypothetical protein